LRNTGAIFLAVNALFVADLLDYLLIWYLDMASLTLVISGQSWPKTDAFRYLRRRPGGRF
jgi:hypothetical protein